jgi:hypothetical protein
LSIFDALSLRGADSDTDHDLVVAEVREMLAVSKQEVQMFDVERFNLRTPSELEIGKQYQIKISNRSPTLENLNYSEDINRAWKNIKEHMNTSAKGSRST